MKNKFQSNGMRCLREALRSVYCLGLPRHWKVVTTILLLLTMGIGSVWGADPLDTYYKFTKTYSSNDTIRPKSGDGGVITLGSNSAAKVTASAAWYLGTTYSHAININNTDAKAFSLPITASTENPAHVFVLVTSDNRTLKLKYGSTDVDQCGVRGTAGTSSYTAAAALVEFVTTNSGNHVIYASGSGMVYAVRVVYEKNDLWKEIKNLSDVTLDKDVTIADDLSTVLFFRMQDLCFNTDGIIPIGNSVGNGLRYSINFKAQKDGTVTVNYANPGSSNRTLTVTEFTRPTTAGTSLVSLSVKSGTTTYSNKDFDVESGKEYVISFGSGATIKSVNFTAATPLTNYTITYNKNGGEGTMANTTNTVAACTFTAPTNKEFKEWNTSANGEGTKWEVGATVTANTDLYAIWKDKTVKYGVTYVLNGPSGDAPTQADAAAGDAITLAAAPSWAGHKFDGWKCNIDNVTRAAGASYTMTAAATTFTAQWSEVDCKIYSLTGGIGSAEKTADNASVSASQLQLSNNNGRIKLTPAPGESFKAGDVITISGTIGATSTANFGVYVYGTNGSTELAKPNVTYNTVPMTATATLTADAEYVFLKRYGGTTTTLYTCEVHRSCAAGEEAGLAYAETAVDKTEGDAAFTNALTNDNGLVVVYGSSNTAVATVAANGQVTVVGPGNATITAYSAVQTKAGVLYAAGTATYALTVSAPPTYTVTYDANGGEGTMTDENSPYLEGAEVTLLANTFTAPTDKAWGGWIVKDAGNNDVIVTDGKFTMPASNVTVKPDWVAPSNFDVKFYQGYGEPDVQIGATQNVATGDNATAPATDPERAGYRFLGWSYDGTEEHIVTVGEYAITATTNFTAVWKQVWTVTFDGAGAVVVDNGAKVASSNSPSQAGKVFQGWYNGESKYDFSANVTGNLALESKWADADANHFYYNYKDDFHYDGVVYKTPDGKVEAGTEESNIAITTPYTLFSGAAGITSIVATNAIYDSKNNWVNSYLKLNTETTSNLVFTIKAGYTAVLKMKMGSWDVSSKAATITLKDAGDNTISYSGTQSGKASTENNYAELTFNLVAGTYTLTTATKTLYISHIDLAATELPKYSVTYNAGIGAVKDGESMPTQADAYEGQVITLASADALEKAGHVFAGWEATYNDGEVKTLTIEEGKFTMPAYAVTVTAQWEDVSKVAQIVETNVKYENLAAAIAAAEAGQTVQLIQNIEQADGVTIAKNLTLDLNGKTYTCTSGSNVNYRAIKITAGTVEIKNGTITAVPTANFEDGCYGALRIDGATASVTCTNATFNNGRHFGLGIKLVEGYLRMENCIVNSENGGGGLEVAGTADLINCTFTQTGLDNSHKWISTCLAVCDNGVLNVQGGTYTSEHYSMYVYTSGGEMDITSGSFTGNIVNQVDNNSYATAVGTIEISGGTFEGVGSDPMVFTVGANNANIAISGGTFDTPILNEYCAEGYVPETKEEPGKYGVTEKDGVCIIKATIDSSTKNTIGSVTGVYKKEASTAGLSSYKFNGKGAYIGLTLVDGESFKENDVINIHTTKAADQGTIALYNDHGDNVSSFYDYEIKGAQGDNVLRLPAAANGKQTIYLCRTEANTWNGYVDYIEVTRVIYPTLKSMTIDGRTVTINEAAKTATCTIPYEADLANLTIVDEVIWNAAAASDAKKVTSNSGNWVIGDNTYRLTDKDGDATTYTITVARDVKKYTVSFNTHGGSAVEPVLVVDGQTLAAAPAEPTKEDYLFQGWAETADGEVVDVTSFTITADKEFHAIWVSDGAIKLINKATGAINTTDFITGVTATEVNSENGAAWGNTQSSLAGANTLNKIVQYNATTTQTKVKVKLYSTNSGAKEVYLHKVLEGETTAVVETIAVASKTPVETEYYTYNNAKNRSFYLTTNSTDVKILQVKVIESGDALPMFGKAGYSLNLDKGRIASAKDVDMTFEGMSYKISSAYAVLSNAELKVKSADGNPYKMSFTVTSPVTMTITESGANYYVYKVVEPEDKGDANAAGTKEFDLTAGAWVIESASTSEAKFTSIAFALPYCEAPVFGTMNDIDLCAGAEYTAINGAATVSDGGNVTYKWYKEGEETVLGTAATYTPSEDGNYYVVATNSLADHQDKSATSGVVKVEHFAAAAITTAPADIATQAGQEKTLTVVATGANLAYVWYTCDDALGTNPVAVVPAATEASLTVTVPDGVQYYKVVVSDNCGAELSAVVKVEGWSELQQVDVTATTTWNMANVSESAINLANLDPSKQNELLLLANVVGVNNDASFNSQALMFKGQHIGRKQSDNVKHIAGQYLQFNVTKSGYVSVTFASNGSSERTVRINNLKCQETSPNTGADDYKTFVAFVQPGSVEIVGMQGTSDNQYVRISEVKFTVDETPDYTRPVSTNIGTLCVEHNVVAGGALGATFYQIAGRNQEYSYKIDFEEVLPGEILKAGYPYVFQSATGRIDLYYDGGEGVDDPIPYKGMYGNFAAGVLDITEENKSDILYIAQNKLWMCEDLVESDLILNEHRCYIKMSDVPEQTPAQNLVPRRRLTISGDQAPAVITGMEGLNVGDQPVKVMIDGQMFILRGEKMYDAQGRLVK